MKKMTAGIIFFTTVILLMPLGKAEHASFTDSQTPPAFKADYLVIDSPPTSSVLTVTLAGDCTLGGTESSSKKDVGFVKTVEKFGLAYPFSGLLTLFAADDVTLINLEGVLSDSKEGENTEKEFAFRGPAAFAQMLPLGSVEAVNLSNNHLDDYGKRGREDTIQALQANGITYAGEEWLSIFSTDRGKIGLAGIRGVLTEEKKKTITRQIDILRNEGCQVVIYSLHAGQEYAKNHNGLQRDMARYLIDAGADVIAGHHPHIAQGIEIYKNRLILYSLGNFIFGGNHNPRVKDALVARVEFHLTNGQLSGIQASLHPICFTGRSKGNEFRPVLLTSKQAINVIKQIQQDTAIPLPEFADGYGVVLPFMPVK